MTEQPFPEAEARLDVAVGVISRLAELIKAKDSRWTGMAVTVTGNARLDLASVARKVAELAMQLVAIDRRSVDELLASEVSIPVRQSDMESEAAVSLAFSQALAWALDNTPEPDVTGRLT